MRIKTKRANTVCCRIWYLLGIMGMFIVISAISHYIFPHLLCRGQKENGEGKSLMISVEDADEAFEINLAAKNTSEMCFEQFLGEKLQISGRKDAEHGYFEGKIVWNGQKICIVNLEDNDSVELKEDIRSFMIGDYYVSTRYDTENEEMELLIFYCP
ncbi:MAG: hypothetical protein IKV27_07425 [Lachnospiraceae bacterium]|nr:hypothetical protein [Lachnospiraceae bacterium]